MPAAATKYRGQLGSIWATGVTPSQFDSYDSNAYRDAVSHATGFAGREHDFYVRAKAEHLVDVCRRRFGEENALSVLDAGSGIGLMDRFLLQSFASVAGCDVSALAVDDARRANPDVDYRLASDRALPFDDESFDVTVASCVLHHVPVHERRSFMLEMRRVTRRDGVVAVFEHNPVNPLTRLVVSRCEFDEGVVLLRPRDVRRVGGEANLRFVELRYLLFFPWAVAALRAAERHALRRLPLGAQYCSVATVGR